MDTAPVGGWSLARGFGDYTGSVVPGPTSFVLGGEASELGKAPVIAAEKKDASNGFGAVSADLKAAMAMKSHSEAERRRRERINAHLAALRGIVPSTDKLDKAALLAEVIRHVKRLKLHAAEICKGYTVPSDVDEVIVEVDGGNMAKGSFLIKATLCCADRPELLAEINRTVLSLKLKILRAEISTLGGRVKNIMVMLADGDVDHDIITTSIQQALKSVLDRITLHADFTPRTSYSNKRRRILPFDCPSSSACGFGNASAALS